MDIEACYAGLAADLRAFLLQLALFLSSVALQHKALLVAQALAVYQQTSEVLLFLSRCPDREVLKVCMGFWKGWAQDIYATFKKVGQGARWDVGERSDAAQRAGGTVHGADAGGRGERGESEG